MPDRKPINVRLPQDVLQATDEKAKALGTTRTALIEEGLGRVLNGEAAGPNNDSVRSQSSGSETAATPKEAKPAQPESQVSDTPQSLPNGDQALVAERMRRLASSIPSTSQRRRIAIRELTEEGKLHAPAQT